MIPEKPPPHNETIEETLRRARELIKELSECLRSEAELRDVGETPNNAGFETELEDAGEGR